MGWGKGDADRFVRIGAAIGAVARNAWAAPRATADLDLAAIVPDRGACDRLTAALALREIIVRQVAGGAGDDAPDLLRLERSTGVVERLEDALRISRDIP